MNTTENYYEPSGELTASIMKKFLHCENQAMAMYNGEYNQEWNDAMLIGGYVDAFVEGTLEEFELNHPEIISSRGKTKGQLKASLRPAARIVEKMQEDPLFTSYLDGEKQKVVRGVIGGMPFKGKLDVYLKGKRIVDLKCVHDVKPSYDGTPFVKQWHYDLQLAIYQELVFQETGKRLPCYLAIAIRDDSNPRFVIAEVNQHNLDEALDEMVRVLPRVKELIEGRDTPRHCNKCKYCEETWETRVMDSDLLGMSDYELEMIGG